MQAYHLNTTQFRSFSSRTDNPACYLAFNEKASAKKLVGAFSFCKGASSKRLFLARLREYRELRATKEWEQERPPACHALRKSDKQSTEVKGFHEWMQSMACQRSGKFSLGNICGLTFSKKRISTYYPAGKNSFANSEVKPN